MSTFYGLRSGYSIADVSECKEGLYWKVYLQQYIGGKRTDTVVTRFRMVTPEGFLKPAPRVGLAAREDVFKTPFRDEIEWVVNFGDDSIHYTEEPYPPRPKRTQDEAKTLQSIADPHHDQQYFIDGNGAFNTYNLEFDADGKAKPIHLTAAGHP